MNDREYIGIDIDETICPLIDSILLRLNRHYNTNYTPKDITRFRFEHTMPFVEDEIVEKAVFESVTECDTFLDNAVINNIS